MTERDVFDEDYLYFNQVYLTPERTARECALIAELCGLGRGASVLDIGCGHGRISNELSRMGMRVTGVETNAAALARAREEARRSSLEVEYVEADFLSLGWSDKFDCVLSWYTSFGLADDDTNRRMLGAMFGAAKPGGRCLIEHINRDRSLKNFQHTMVHQRDENFMIDLIELDPLTSRSLRTRKFCRDGQTRTTRYEIRLFTFAELADWMRQAGFADLRGYGHRGEIFTLESERMIAVGIK